MQEVLALTGLQQLSPETLVPSLTQLAHYLAAAGHDEREALSQWPGFIAFLGGSLGGYQGQYWLWTLIILLACCFCILYTSSMSLAR